MRYVPNVLFIEYFYPPLLPQQRTLILTRLLSDFGWHPIVISANGLVRYPKDYDSLTRVPKSVGVHRVGHTEPSPIKKFLLRKLKLTAYFPDYFGSWLHPAHEEARKVIKSNPIHLIYSASPTFAAAMIAERLQREFGIPWIADFLDGLAVNDFHNWELDRVLREPFRSIHRSRLIRLERSIVRSADRVVTMSWHVRDRLCQLHGIRSEQIEVVTGGYDESVHQCLEARRIFPGKLTITFLGGLYGPLVDTMQKFLKVLNTVERNPECVFVGSGASVVHDMNFPNTACVLHLPMRKSLELGLGSSFLLVVMPSFAKWIPSKIYDYLRLGRPILALVPNDGDAAKIIRGARAGYILSYDSGEMRKQLEAIFDQWEKGELENFHPEMDYVRQFEQTKLSKTIAGIFDAAAGQRRPSAESSR